MQKCHIPILSWLPEHGLFCLAPGQYYLSPFFNVVKLNISEISELFKVSFERRQSEGIVERLAKSAIEM